MQNAGQYGPGAAGAHQSQPFVPSEPSPNSGSTTSSLRQFRKKDVDKSNLDQPQKQASDGQIGRMPPHNPYPTISNDCYRYPTHQFSDYSSQAKYSNTPETSQANHITTSVIQKPKSKDYMEICNMQQPHLMKSTYPSHIPNHQQYLPDNSQYIHKETNQIHPSGYKPESHFFSKEQHQYQQLLHPMQPKFNPMMAQNIRKYNAPTPSDNPFLSKLSKIDPSMARSIISDHHVQDNQNNYPTMDQRSIYPQQNRYYPGPMYQQNQYPPNPAYAINATHYPSYPSTTCSYPRTNQMPPMPSRFHPMERSISPSRRSYPENMHMPHMNIPQKITQPHNYQAQYAGPEYSQHYQHRRMPQEMYPQPCRPPQYVQNHHQVPGQDIQEMSENTVSPSDSLKKFIENWAEEETNNEMGVIENNAAMRENMKIRDDPPSGTVYMINATDVQYFENSGIPLVTSDNGGIQLTPENYQYLLKNGLIDNSGVVRIMEPSSNNERVVNLQIMEASKSDCLVANKSRPKECELSPIGKKPDDDSKKVVIHQNTVVNMAKDVLPIQQNMEQVSLHEAVIESINASKELVDKNCSPINLDQLDSNKEYNDIDESKKDDDIISSPSNIKRSNSLDDSKMVESPDENKGLKSMPIIDLFSDSSLISTKVTEQDTDQPNFNPEKEEPQDVDEILEEKVIIDQSEGTKESINDPPSIKVEDNETPEDVVNFDDLIENSSNSINDSHGNEPDTRPSEENIDDQIIDSKTCIEIIDVDDNKESIIPPPSTIESSSSTNIVAPLGKRKRIFSVDDIIHNIGNNTKKPPELDACNLDVLKNFITRETEYSSLEQLLVLDSNYSDIKKEIIEVQEQNQHKSVNENKTNPKTDEQPHVSANKESVIELEHKDNSPVESPSIVNIEEKSNNDVHYRRAITIDESSVLLQISGELIEININIINGKKVITVVPISDTTVVDYNDNYELPSNDDDSLMENVEDCEKLADVASKITKTDKNITELNDISQETAQDEVKLSLDKPCEDPTGFMENVVPDSETKLVEIESNERSSNEIDKVQAEVSACQLEPNTEVLEYPIGEEEILIPTELSHEIVVSDPLEFCVDIDRTDLNLHVEPVSTSEILLSPDTIRDQGPPETIIKKFDENKEQLILPENQIPPDVNTSNSLCIGQKIVEDKHNRRNIKSEVLILSPTSTNIDDNFCNVKENVYLKPNVPSSDGELLDNSTSITTKAAKKSYEMDLQIPAVTTSGDISATVKKTTGDSQDRVSSSKKEKNSKNVDKIKKSNKKSSKLEKIKKRKKSPISIMSDKKNIVNNNKDIVKDNSQMTNNIVETDDEYVDFKELLKARKLKKQKKLQQLKEKQNRPVPDVVTKSYNNGFVLKNDVIIGESKDNVSKQTSKNCDQKSNQEDTSKSLISKPPEIDNLVKPSGIESNKTGEDLNVQKKINLSDDTPTSTSLGTNGTQLTRDKPHQSDNQKTSKNTQGIVLVPSVSELMEEGALAGKKKISYLDYVKRKRKESGDHADEITASKKPKTENNSFKNLETVKTTFIIPNSDWEDTGSPKPNLKQSSEDSLIQEFSGLIKSNQKPVTNVKEYSYLDSSTDIKLREYKETVDSKLNSLNIQIPKPKSQAERTGTYKSPETSSLMQRFLNNEKITMKEVERIKRIISYKRYIEKHGKPPSCSELPADLPPRKSSPKYLPPLSTSYEIQSRANVDVEKQEVKLHIRKVGAKRKIDTELGINNESSFSQSEKNESSENKMDYSVYNRLGKDGLPKMIFKRNRQSNVSDDNDTNQPVVRLERIDLSTVKEKYNITVTNMLCDLGTK